MPLIGTRHGVRRVPQAYIIIDRRTGAWYRPRRRGFSGWRYTSRYAAQASLNALPEKARHDYVIVADGAAESAHG